MTHRLKLILLILLTVFFTTVHAGEADVIKVEAECEKNYCRFKVTVQHKDTGWDHYAKGIEILNIEKTRILGFRPLRHPHVDEQPFTRTISVLFSEPVEKVVARAYDSKHEYGGKELIVNVPTHSKE